MSTIERISGNIVDVLNSRTFPGTIEISNGRIINILQDNKRYRNFIIPGFIDSHVHIESSLLPPSEFARLAVRHGTVAIVADPHEIANVLGLEGIRYMIEDAKGVPLKFYFGAPSCVPATRFETSGAEIRKEDIEILFQKDEASFLSEVMNFSGVVRNDPQVMEKINLARKYQRPIDGHAPELRGKELEKYVNAGISTDHESIELDEALEKIKLGMKIQIREGSEARNFETLYSLIDSHPDHCMLCCDDILPDDLTRRHIDTIVRMALKKGIDKMKVLKSACITPVLHYKLDVGLLQRGDHADFIIVDNLEDFNILKTIINGETVASNGRSLIPRIPPRIINNFNVHRKSPSDFSLKASGSKINVIEAIDGQLITNRIVVNPRILDGYVTSDVKRDILKATVVNRYKDRKPSIGFVKNFGLKRGAIAFSVGHDSHNITSVGVSDEDICRAINLIIENKGGLSVVYDGSEDILPLPIGGLMSDDDGFKVAEKYLKLLDLARALGTELKEPFVNLSFISLLVIPDIKLSDMGLFDSNRFKFMKLFEKQ